MSTIEVLVMRDFGGSPGSHGVLEIAPQWSSVVGANGRHWSAAGRQKSNETRSSSASIVPAA